MKRLFSMQLGIFLLLMVFIFGIGDKLAQAHSEAQEKTQEKATLSKKNENSIQSLNTKLQEITTKYNEAIGQEKKNLEVDLAALVSQRKVLMASQADTDPVSFKNLSMPENIRKQLPGALQKDVEQDGDIQGTLKVLHGDDFVHNTGTYIYTLETPTAPNGKSYTLHFQKEPTDLIPESTIKIHGKVLDTDFVAALGGATAGASVVRNAAISQSGVQKTIIIMINFTNNTTQPNTAAQLAARVFTAASSTSAYYQDSSFGQTSFSGDVVGWFTVPYTNASCESNYSNWATAADNAATASGVDLTQYSRKLYFTNVLPACSYGGLAYIGGNQAWIFGSMYPGGFEHELGHNIGANHAQSLNCGSLAVNTYSKCSIDEYGDSYDTMGFWNTFQWNMGHKIGANWIPTSQIVTATTSGTYTLAPLEASTTAVQVLKIPKPDSSDYYYIGYRQPVGFDAALPSTMTNGAEITTWNGYNGSQTKLIDATPGDNNFANAALADNATFNDQINGITVTQSAHDGVGVTLNVAFYTPVCMKASPMVSTYFTSGVAGRSVNFNVATQNNDSSICGPTTFALLSSIPAGWSATTSNSTITLAANASGNNTLILTSPVGTPDGTYTFTVTSSDINDQTHQGTATTSINIYTPCTAYNPSLTLSPLSQSGSAGQTLSYLASINNNDTKACSASTFNVTPSLPIGWSAATSSLSVPSAASTTQSVLVTAPAGTAAGSYDFAVILTDAASSTRTSTATSTFVVATCSKSNPSLSASPSSQTGTAGKILSYILTLTNNDSSACSPKTFALSSVVPSGWTGTQTSLTLSPGAISTTTLTVTSPQSVINGTYSIAFNATDTVDALHKASALANYVASTPVPTVTLTSPTNGSSFSKRVTSTINISSSANYINGVSQINLYNGTTLLKQCVNVTTCTYSWNISAQATGTRTIKATALGVGTTTLAQAVSTITINR